MIRTCAACGKKNRIPAAHLADRGKCGACKAAIDPVRTPIDVGPEQLQQIVEGTKVPVLIDFWAEWCGPCRMAVVAAGSPLGTAGQWLLGQLMTIRERTDLLS